MVFVCTGHCCRSTGDKLQNWIFCTAGFVVGGLQLACRRTTRFEVWDWSNGVCCLKRLGFVQYRFVWSQIVFDRSCMGSWVRADFFIASRSSVSRHPWKVAWRTGRTGHTQTTWNVLCHYMCWCPLVLCLDQNEIYEAIELYREWM